MDTSKVFKSVIWIGLIVLFITPFVVSRELFFPFITGKAYLFRIVTEIIFFVWVALAVSDKKYRPTKGAILYAFILFLISIFISNVTGIDSESSFWSNFERMEGYVTLVHLFGLFLALSSTLKSKTEWLVLFNSSVASSVIMFFVAADELYKGFSVGGFNTRVDTTLGNSTYLAVFMLINFFLTLYLIFEMFVREKKNRFLISFYSIIAIIQAVIVFQTGTRGAMIGLAAGIVVIAISLIIFERKNKILRNISIGFVSAVIVFAGLLFTLKDSSFVKNYQAFNRLVTISPSEGTAKARILNWQIAWEGVKERPVFGWGQSNFNYVFNKYYLPEHYGNEAWFDRVHNIIFDWAIAGGFVGLGLYLLLWIATLYSIWIKKNDLEPFEKSTITGLLVAYFVHNFFVFDQIVSYILFVIVLSYVHSRTGNEIKSIQKDLSDQASYSVISISVLAMFASIWFINIPSLTANYSLIQSLVFISPRKDGTATFYHAEGLKGNINLYEKALNQNSFGNPEIIERFLLNSTALLQYKGIDQNDISMVMDTAVGRMVDLIEEKKYEARYPYILGSFFANVGNMELAESYLKKGIELSPRKQSMRIPLIRVYLVEQKVNEAAALAKETYELDKTKDDLWIEYARTLLVANMTEFENLFMEAAENKSFEKNDRLVNDIISRQPDNRDNYILFASLYFKSGQKEKSIELLKKMGDNLPDAKMQSDSIIKLIESGKNPLGLTF